MDIGLLSILNNRLWDFRADMAQEYAQALKGAIALHISGADEHKEKQRGFFLSRKRGMEDKLYIGNIHRIENHLYWNDEELADDDQIINVVCIDGPITRDGGACSYGSKDHRDQILYANTIPQVVGHLFFINTPGGEAAARNDYEYAIADCREKGKPTVSFVDGMCCSAGVNLASRTDRVIVMNPRDEYGCIGSMAAFWATPDGAIDRDGSRWVEIVGKDSPEKNAWWREAAKGEYKKLKEMVDKSTEEFHQSVRENRPLVTDAMLTGDVFDAKDLIPALVDEIGDYNRAIECIFELAEGRLTPARDVKVIPEEPSGDDGDDNENGGQENMATLNEQQKAAVSTSRGDTMIVEDGHVKKSVPTMFGQEEVEVANPKKENDMKEEEKKQEEVREDAPAVQEVEEKPTGEESVEESHAEEEVTEEAVEESPAGGNDVTEEENGTSAESQEQTGQTEKLIEELSARHAEEISTLSAEKERLNDMVTERDGIIAERDGIIAERDKTIAEQQARIEELTAEVAAQKKALSEKDAEIKELSEKPTPMVDASAGVPADNGTGDAPKSGNPTPIRPGMTYRQIREAMKHQS